MTGTPARVFVVIAAYNEAGALAQVLADLPAPGREVVVVDDGSFDHTARTVPPAVHRLRHPVNRGQGAALLTGIRHALAQGAEVVVTFDADGQHDPADIPGLVAPILAGECDVVLGSRFLGHTEAMPWSRRLVLKLGILFTRVVSRIRVTDVHNGLRAFSRQAATDLQISMDRMAHASEILDQVRAHGWRYREVGVTVRYSAYSLAKGQTSWNAVRIAAQLMLEKLRR